MIKRLQQFKSRIERASFLARKELVQRMSSPVSESRVIFVAGVQRSGTNMLMDAFERSYETEVFHERDPRAFDNYQLRDYQVIHRLVNRSRAPFVVIKCLMECQKLAEILHEFSGSSAVWVFRNYADVVNSMLRSFRNQAAQVKRIAINRESDGWLGERMSDQTHEIIKRLVTDELDDATGAALQWYFRNIRYFEQDLDQRDDVSIVHYDNLVRSPENELRHIFQTVGLEFTPPISRHINAASIRRRPPPTIDGQVAELCESLYQRLQQEESPGTRSMSQRASGGP